MSLTTYTPEFLRNADEQLQRGETPDWEEFIQAAIALKDWVRAIAHHDPGLPHKTKAGWSFV